MAICILVLHYLILFTVKTPLAAEYWLHDYLVAKLGLAKSMNSPKFIFSGGSATLFGIDAAEVQKKLGRPAVNLGLHAGLRLEDHLAYAREAARPGDILVLSLEPAYYETYSTAWTTWQFRNALAWNRPSLARLPLGQRLIVYFTASDPTISYDLVAAAYDEKFSPDTVGWRLKALQPEPQVFARYLTDRGTSHEFVYWLSNLDSNGDVLNTKSGEALFNGDAYPVSPPAHISAYARSQLVPFLAEMKKEGVRVYFDYTPYLIYPSSTPGNWQAADRSFRDELGDIGGTLLENRDALFFPVEDFYHSDLHLNEVGRRLRTANLIEALRPLLSPAPSK